MLFCHISVVISTRNMKKVNRKVKSATKIGMTIIIIIPLSLFLNIYIGMANMGIKTIMI